MLQGWPCRNYRRMLKTCESLVSHLWVLYESLVSQFLSHLWVTCESICESFVSHLWVNLWVIYESLVSQFVSHLFLLILANKCTYGPAGRNAKMQNIVNFVKWWNTWGHYNRLPEGRDKNWTKILSEKSINWTKCSEEPSSGSFWRFSSDFL